MTPEETTARARAAAIALRPVPLARPGNDETDVLDRLAVYPEGFTSGWLTYICENRRWVVQRTSHKVVGGPFHGKYILQVLFQEQTPNGSRWVVRIQRIFTSRAASIRWENHHYAKHSPVWARENGHA